jgi:hypothetical protein
MRDNYDLAAMMDPGAGVHVDPNQVAPSFATPPPTEEDTKKVESDFEEHRDPKGKTVWSSTPTFENQYKRFPETTRLVGPIVAVYDAANPEQLKELNTLFSKQQPEEAPSIMIASRKENFHDGKWLMLLEYFRVEYKQLITTS